jgi:hypothetical protein
MSADDSRPPDANTQQLLYVSNTSRDTPQPVLDDILAVARRNNPALGVTGMLLYVDGGFLQVLEGAGEVLEKLYAKIAADKRHWNAQILLKRRSPRAFGDWSMGFHRPSPSEQRELFQISNGAIAGHLADGDQPVLLRLMENFYRIQSGEASFPRA